MTSRTYPPRGRLSWYFIRFDKDSCDLLFGLHGGLGILQEAVEEQLDLFIHEWDALDTANMEIVSVCVKGFSK